jgi:hypothetical protein
MRRFINMLGLIAALAISPLAWGEGRYQAVTLSDGSGMGPEKIVILDTVAGHLWIWSENAASPSAPGGRYLIYQGQIRPGSKMGEIVLKQEWSKGGK